MKGSSPTSLFGFCRCVTVVLSQVGCRFEDTCEQAIRTERRDDQGLTFSDILDQRAAVSPLLSNNHRGERRLHGKNANQRLDTLSIADFKRDLRAPPFRICRSAASWKERSLWPYDSARNNLRCISFLQMGEIAHQPWGEVCWYFEDTWEQFRLLGLVNVIGNDEEDPRKKEVRLYITLGLQHLAGRKLCGLKARIISGLERRSNDAGKRPGSSNLGRLQSVSQSTRMM
jgi:hypothetical protein